MVATKLRVRSLYRVSTKGQLEEDDIPMQRIACEEFAKSKSEWSNIEHEYLEKGVSGYKVSAKNRDIVQDVIHDAEKGLFDVLLVFMFDRIGRRTYETPLLMKTLDKLGIQLWSAKEGQQKFDDHSDDLINFIRFWQSGGESKKTSMRVDTDHSQMVEAGLFRGGSRPYGYTFEKSGRYNKKGKELLDIKIDEEQSKIVYMIYMLVYEKGYGGNRIAGYLNEQGIPSAKGGKWNAGVVNYILRNPLYKGYFVYGRRRSDEDGHFTTQSKDKWILSKEAIENLIIVPEEVWDKVQEIRTSRSPENMKDESVKTIIVSKSPLLFVSRIKCGHCGSPLTTTYNTRSYTKKDGKISRYRIAKYRCSGKALKKTNCDGQTIYAQKKIEDTVLDEIDIFLSQFENEDVTNEIEKLQRGNKNEEEKEIKKIKRKLTEANNELSTLEGEVIKSLMGKSHFKPELLNSLIDDKKNEIGKLESEIEKLNDVITIKESESKEMREMKKYIPIWKDEFHKMGFEKKKMLLSNIIDNITVWRDDIEVEFNLKISQFLKSIAG